VPHGDLLGRRLQAARDRAFVGRSEQLGLFRTALDGDPASPTVFYLHGPGGIGKSMLLRRFAAEAEADGRLVVEVDGRTVEPSPSAVEAEAAPSLVDDRAVLLIDTFERCQGLEGWVAAGERQYRVVHHRRHAVGVQERDRVVGHEVAQGGDVQQPGPSGVGRPARVGGSRPATTTSTPTGSRGRNWSRSRSH
jgi:hypothetical protein